MTIEHAEKRYIPAAGRDWTLPLYDPMTRIFGVDRCRRHLVEQAELRPGDRVLDVGCGTGSLAVSIKRDHEFVWMAALDPDPKALARARRKAEAAGVRIQFDTGFADALPYPDASFDRVFSSFMFHHLQGGDKPGMLREVHRVLAPGGRLEMVDFAGPDAGSRGLLARVLHSHRLLKDNAADRVVGLMKEAGFEAATQVGRERLLVGHIAYYQASNGRVG